MRLFCILLLVIVNNSIVAAENTTNVIRIGYVPSVAFTPNQGHLYPLTSCIVEKIQPAIFITQPSFNRMALALKNNNIDIAIHISPLPARDKYLTYLGDEFKYRVLKILKEGVDIDADNNVFGVRLGDSMTDNFNLEDTKYLLLKDTDLLVTLFLAERIQGFVEVEPLIYQSLEELKKNNIGYRIFPIGYESAGIYANNVWANENPLIVDTIKAALNSCSHLLSPPYFSPNKN